MSDHIYTPDFPVSTPLMIAWALLLIIATMGFVQWLIYLNRKGHRKTIILIFGLLLMAGTAIHTILLARSTHTVSAGNWIQLVMISAVAGLEMFIGHTVVFDDIIAAVIFREPGLMIAYISTFVLIIAFTITMVLLIMPRRIRDRGWLWMHRSLARRDAKNHIFLGVDRHAKEMSASILHQWGKAKDRKDQGEVILVDFPGEGGPHSEISLGDLVTNVFGQHRELSLEKQLGSDRFTLLKGSLPQGDSSKGLCEAIGLSGLTAWLENPRTTLYLLTPDEDKNIQFLKYLAEDPSVKAKILCYSQRVNSYTSLVAAMGDRIRLVNLPEMSFNELKQNHPQLHPVRFADVARNSKGEPLGYVRNPSTSMLIGFKETGQEALRFLYEFGSFLGEDMKPIANEVKVYDPEIESLKGDFLNRTPALRYGASIAWSSATVGSSQFWLEYAMALPNLSYVVVSAETGGEHNVEIAVQLLQEASRYGKDLSRLCILVCAHQADAQMLHLIEFYNRCYCPEGVSVIQPFGLPGTLWNLNVVSGKNLKERALECMAPDKDGFTPKEIWALRSLEIRERGGNTLLNRQELLRKQAGDIGRSLFAPTLVQLCPARLREAAANIPDELDPQNPVHFVGSKADYKIMEYLAAGEHLHWMTALEAAGYIDGHDVQDELNKKIRNLVPYQDLPDEESRHLCWVGLKLALLHAKE